MDPRFTGSIPYVSAQAARTVGLDEVERLLRKHHALDWGYAPDHVCADNDEHMLAGSGLVSSQFPTTRGHRLVITSDLDQQHTLVRLAAEG